MDSELSGSIKLKTDGTAELSLTDREGRFVERVVFSPEPAFPQHGVVYAARLYCLERSITLIQPVLRRFEA